MNLSDEELRVLNFTAEERRAYLDEIIAALKNVNAEERMVCMQKLNDIWRTIHGDC